MFPLLGRESSSVTNRRFQKQIHRQIEAIVENYEEVTGLLESPEAFHDYKLDRRRGPVGPRGEDV